MTELSTRARFRILPMLLLAGLFLGACSGGGDGGNGSPPSAGPPQAGLPPGGPLPPIVAQLAQQGYLKASNTNADDLFGLSVALSGDTLVVGAAAGAE